MWREHSEPTGIADLLNYAFLVAPGVMLLKDGGLLTGFYYLGPDLDYAAPEEMERLSAQVNAAAMRCGTGWSWHIDLIRRPAMGYLPQGAFTHPTLALIDEEARRRYSAEGHYESVHTLTMTYLPPPEIEEKVSALFTEGTPDEKPGWETILASFSQTVTEIEGMLAGALRLNRMTDADLLTYLHMVVTGLDHPVRVPPIPVDLDSIIADQDMVTGWSPEMGAQHVRVLSIDGFPQMTEPGAQAFLHELPMSYRWSTRFLFLDRADAAKLIQTKRKHWWQRRHKFHQSIVESHTQEASPFNDENAVDMAKDASAAAAEVESGDVVYGLLTSTLIVSDEDKPTANHKRKVLQEHVQQHGYGCRYERVNAVEALIGSWAGHGEQNLRRVPIHTLNLADLLPLTSIWTGLETNPNPYFPTHSPPLMMATTTGQTPMRVHLHVSDVGHCLVQGPTGSGKSFLTLMAAAQYARFPGAQVAYFDKGYSSFVLAHAIGAAYYDLGVDEIGLYPFGQVDDEQEREWALDWLSGVLVMQGVRCAPMQVNAIWRALTLLGESTSRTMTDFVATVQDLDIRAALQHYCLGGGAGSLLDGDHDSLQYSQYMFFETAALLERGPKDSVPILRYIAHRIEQRCQDGVPTLIVMDEENLHEEQLERWLRGLRKKNAAVMVTVHSLEDVEKSPYRSVLMDACKTKFFLPNSEARNQVALYEQAGLHPRQAEILSTLTNKRHYFSSADIDGVLRQRVIDLQAGPVARAILGAGGREDIARARAVMAQYGEEWGVHWLTERGCREEAKWWQQWRVRQGETTEQRRRNYETALWGSDVLGDGTLIHHE